MIPHLPEGGGVSPGLGGDGKKRIGGPDKGPQCQHDILLALGEAIPEALLVPLTVLRIPEVHFKEVSPE
jgi:hypothetical protein